MDEAFALIASQAGKHFDPALAACFLGLRAELEAIRQRWQETA